MMKLGCLGCLATLMLGVLLFCLGAGALWVWNSAQATPTIVPASSARADAGTVSRRIAEIGLREAGRSTRREPLVFSEAEAAAFLSGYLGDAGLRLTPLNVGMRAGRVTAQGRLPLWALMQGPPLAWLHTVMPRRSLETPVWITLTATVQLEPRAGGRRSRYAEATLVDTQVGRLSLPGWLLTLMLGPRGSGLLRGQVPAVVERIDIGDGKVTISTR
jgi:hypothetical protein